MFFFFFSKYRSLLMKDPLCASKIDHNAPIFHFSINIFVLFWVSLHSLNFPSSLSYKMNRSPGQQIHRSKTQLKISMCFKFGTVDYMKETETTSKKKHRQIVHISIQIYPIIVTQTFVKTSLIFDPKMVLIHLLTRTVNEIKVLAKIRNSKRSSLKPKTECYRM